MYDTHKFSVLRDFCHIHTIRLVVAIPLEEYQTKVEKWVEFLTF